MALAVGPRHIWLRSSDGDVWMAHEEGSRESPPGESTPPTLEPPRDSQAEWTRWATPEGERVVELRPELPDRTLVLTTERSFRLLPRAGTHVYVRVPLWIRVELPREGGRPPLLLQTIPSLSMSDTWWGDFQEGELTYWLPTTARREMRPELHLDHLGVCPFHITNRSDEELKVEKLAFRVAHLSLFADETGHFWADETRVTYHGEQEGSEIDMSGTAPTEAKGATLAAPPQVPMARGFRARTFQRLKELPGMGGAP